MKETEKKHPIPTIPKGVWETERPQQKNEPKANIPYTDLQGNGYPKAKENK